MNSRLETLIEENFTDETVPNRLSAVDKKFLSAIDRTLTELEHNNTRLVNKLSTRSKRLSDINNGIVRQYSYINELLHIDSTEPARPRAQLRGMQNLLLQYKSAVESSLIISKTDITGKITYVNDNFCTKSGYSREELIGRDHNILRHPDTKSSTYEKLWKTILAKKVWQGRLRNIKKDGSDYYVNPTVVPILDTHGKVIEFLAIRRDITEKIKNEKKLLSEQKKATAILNNQESVIVISNQEEGVVDVNKKFLELFDFSSLPTFKEKYKCVCGLFNEKDGYVKKSTEERYWADAVMQSPQKIHKALILSGSDTGRIFNIKSRHITLNDKPFYLSTFTDITELEQVREKAEDAQKAKSEFLANMSHEVRTPLNSLSGFLQLLERSELTEEQRQYIEIAQSSMHTLLGVVNDVLDFSKIESGKLETSPVKCDPHKVFNTLFNSLSPMAENKNITYRLAIDPAIHHCIRMDELHVTQVLQNLLNNALKFTLENGSVDLRIESISKKETVQTIKFSVQDTGIGISKDKIGTIMQPFSQADSSTTRKFGGTGLGLSISKSLIELMGGELQVISSKGDGSIFFFEIDVGKCRSCTVQNQKEITPDDTAETTKPLSENNRALNILIAEDYEVNQMFMKILMDSYDDVTYHFANDGEEVLAMLRYNHYDLIFMDINMPILNGIDTTVIIKQELKLDIPIIALTANALEGDREKFLSIGMDDYLAKPLDIKDIDRILKKYR